MTTMTEMTTALDGLDNMATACHMKFLSFFSDKHRKVWNDEVCDIVVSKEANEYFDNIRDIVALSRRVQIYRDRRGATHSGSRGSQLCLRSV